MNDINRLPDFIKNRLLGIQKKFKDKFFDGDIQNHIDFGFETENGSTVLYHRPVGHLEKHLLEAIESAFQPENPLE